MLRQLFSKTMGRSSRSGWVKPEISKSRRTRDRRLAVESLEPRAMLNVGPLVISEFVAANATGLKDADGDASDWIEIYNPGPAAVDLDGWYLTDNADDLTKWEFPSVPLAVGDFRVVFASDKDRTDPAGELHTNFKLSAGGEYLALVQPNGTTIASEFDPFPQQYDDISYGIGQQVIDLAPEGTDFRYHVPSVDDASLDWTIPSFDDSAWAENGEGPTVLITEAGTGSPDYVEVQNVTDHAIDTSGWYLVVNKALGAGVNVNTFVYSNTCFPASLAPGQVVHWTDWTSENYFGKDIPYGTSGKGWAMVMDAQGVVRDYVPWVYTAADVSAMNITVDGHNVRGSKLWSGLGVPASVNPTTDTSVYREGNLDRDNASDFVFRKPLVGDPAALNRGLQNPDLALPVLPGGLHGAGYSVTPFGFGSSIQTDLEAGMRNVNASLWTRTQFEVADPSAVQSLQLKMKYNDGFVAYLNGEEIARRNAPAQPGWDSSATASRTAQQSVEAEIINVTASLDHLTAGVNVLAIQGMNVSAGDANFLLVPELIGAASQDVLRYMLEPSPGAVNQTPMTTEMPGFSNPATTFVNPFGLELSSLNGVVRYTLDGTDPDAGSPLYADPIPIGTTVQVRARVFEEGLAPGPVAIHQYLALAADMQGFTSNLPILVLENFNGGTPPADYMQPAFMAIFEQNGGRSSVINVPNLQTSIGLKIRGSSSATWPKHHFGVEAQDDNGQDKDISPLGMPKDSDWILISAYDFDLAMMRNPLVYEISNAAGRYAVRTEFVEVFFNSNGGPLSYADHFGVYALAEKISVSPDRVDIDPLGPSDNTAPDVTGGYIVKVDRLDPGDSGFNVGGIGTVAFVEPKEDDLTPAQRSYIASYFNQAKTALDSPNFADPLLGYAQYLDVESWIDHSWINVLTKNVDAFRLSGFMYKPRNGKIVAGPVWDFDRSMDSTDSRDNEATTWQTTEDDFFSWGWYGRLFQDPNFAQRNVDRWYELRQGAFKTTYILGLINSYQAQLAEAAVRNFQTWPTPTPRGGWQGEVNLLKTWLTTRLNWIDAQFQPMPQFSPIGGQVAAPLNLTMTATKGTIYYTLDGSDPRAPGGGVSPSAIAYVPGTPVLLDESTRVTARTFVTGTFAVPVTNWSAPKVAEFYVHTPPAAGNLAITELHYNPYPPSVEEDPQGGFSSDDFEFIELLNTGNQTLDMAGVEFTNGVTFRFPLMTLSPGERTVIVENLTAFQARYGTDIVVAGTYDGNLNDDGEQITLVDRAGQIIHAFAYDDGGAWPGRADGTGSSLQIVNVAMPYGDGNNWRSSTEFGGSPGTVESGLPVGIVVNEVLSHTEPGTLDAIELYNPTADDINISGWYLSDSSDNYLKFCIPDDTILVSGGYVVYDESDFNPSGGIDPELHPNDFALDGTRGDDVWLWQADDAGNLTLFVDHVDFSAAASGETVGRWPNGSGKFYPLAENTLGDANAGPRVGPVVITELHYHPIGAGDSDREFVEIFNPTSAAIDLENWRIRGGIDFDFRPGMTIGAGSALLVLPFDPDDQANAALLAGFLAAYNLDDSTPMVGGYTGRLANSGDRVELQRPGDHGTLEDPTYIPHWIEDEVAYDDALPWPGADGNGLSLQRREVGLWGNDAQTWLAAEPTPGQVGFSATARIAGRHVFYNNSGWDGMDPGAGPADDTAIAVDKQALLPGETAAFANYTSYSRGINGIMVDVAGLANAADLAAADFRFVIGNDSNPGGWDVAPAPLSITVRAAAGDDGSDRITLIWADGTIAGRWLQVTVLATNHTGLAEPDVFYFGNAVGDAGNHPGNAIVNATDEIMARNFPHSALNPAAINDPCDYDRDGLVNGTDWIVSRNHQTNPLTMLRLIAAPPVEAGVKQASTEEPDLLGPSPAELDWLYELQQISARSAKKTRPAEAAVDKLLATYW